MKSNFFYLESLNETGLVEFLEQKYPQKGGYVVFLCESEIEHIGLLQDVFNRMSVPFFGAIFPGIVHKGEFKKNGILLLYFPAMPQYFFTGNLLGFSQKNSESIEPVLEKVSGWLKKGEKGTLFMLFDGMLPNIASVLESLYFRFFDNIGYLGGNAGSETFRSIGCLFDNHRVEKNCALMAKFENHSGVFMEHGYQLPANRVTATSTNGNRINSIEWKPAFEVYSELIRNNYNVDVTPENFYEYGVHFPFAIIRADKNLVIRIPVGHTEDGALFCTGEIPPTSILTLLQLPDAPDFAAMDAITSGLSGNIENGDDILMFYCSGRRHHLGLRSLEELGFLEKSLPENIIAGAVTLGEVGNSRGVNFPLFQNSAVLCSGI